MIPLFALVSVGYYFKNDSFYSKNIRNADLGFVLSVFIDANVLGIIFWVMLSLHAMLIWAY